MYYLYPYGKILLKGGDIMNSNELSRLISDSATKTYNDNIEYLAEHHIKELESIFDEGGKVELIPAINRIMTSSLRSAIELSTMNTIKVLKSLGVVIPELSCDDLPQE